MLIFARRGLTTTAVKSEQRREKMAVHFPIAATLKIAEIAEMFPSTIAD